jgi:hypothetical protein
MITLDVTEFRSTLDAVAQRQLPFAAVKGMNTLMTTFQAAQREFDAETFTLRRSEWIDRSVKITQFATKQNPVGVVGIHPPGGDARADILGKFEEGGVKQSTGVHGLVAIPIQVKRSKAGIIPDSLRPKNLHLTGARGGMLGKGNQRTFIVQLANGDRAIFQRISTRSRDKRRLGRRLLGLDPNVLLLYYLKPSVPIPAELHFHDHAAMVTKDQWERIFNESWASALATAR